MKCEQQLREAKAAAQKLHDDTMAHAEDLYNQTKNKTDNMLQAAMAECNKLREEAKAYADKLRSSAEVDAESCVLLPRMSAKNALTVLPARLTSCWRMLAAKPAE